MKPVPGMTYKKITYEDDNIIRVCSGSIIICIFMIDIFFLCTTLHFMPGMNVYNHRLKKISQWPIRLHIRLHQHGWEANSQEWNRAVRGQHQLINIKKTYCVMSVLDFSLSRCFFFVFFFPF